MSAARKREEVAVEQAAERRDLRVEMKVKNNVLWHAIFDRYRSVSALCRTHPGLLTGHGEISLLLRFKISPFKKQWSRGCKESYYTDQYRQVCLRLERILKVPAEDLFPKDLYEAAVGGVTEQVLEVSSFTALPTAVRREIRLLPAPGDEAPDVMADRELLRERLGKVLKTLSFREREIIKLRYGLPDGYEYSRRQVAFIFKVTPERVRQIEAKAILKLQHPFRAVALEGFLD